jgi:hypothetical protein
VTPTQFTGCVPVLAAASAAVCGSLLSPPPQAVRATNDAGTDEARDDGQGAVELDAGAAKDGNGAVEVAARHEAGSVQGDLLARIHLDLLRHREGSAWKSLNHDRVSCVNTNVIDKSKCYICRTARRSKVHGWGGGER